MATKIKLGEFFNRINKYIVESIVPGMGPSIVRGGMNVLGSLGVAQKLFTIKNEDFMGMTLLDLMAFLEIFNQEDGMVDIDQLQKAKDSFYAVEAKLSFKGLHFDEQDAARLVDTLRGGPAISPTNSSTQLNGSFALCDWPSGAR